jgi:hypothetical protein
MQLPYRQRVHIASTRSPSSGFFRALRSGFASYKDFPKISPEKATDELTPQSKRKVLEKGEYLKNIDESNKAVQKLQIQNWESKRRSNSKGVEASDVMKK